MSNETETTKRGVGIGEKDQHEFPEGGRGWFVLLGMWIVMGISYGLINAYGEYQSYYTKLFPDTKQSVLTLIGSLQPFMIYVCSIPSNLLIHKYGPKIILAAGGVIIIFSLMMISICKSVWQLFLAQGVAFGIGCSLCVFVGFSLPQQWFKKRRALAVGICASGSSLGGMLWPIAFNKLMDQVGFHWTNRIIGFIYIPLVVIAVLGAKARPITPPAPVNPQAEKTIDGNQVQESSVELDLEDQVMNQDAAREKLTQDTPELPRRNIFVTLFKTKSILDWSVLKDYHFVLYIISNSVAFFALFPPLFFLPSYASRMGASPNITKYILTIANAGSVVGRIAPGYIGDKIGRVNSLIPCLFFSGLTPLVFWLPCKSDALLIIFAVTFGISSGAVVSLGPATLGQLFGVKDLKSRLSFFLLLSAPGCLAGPGIAGTFLPDSLNAGTHGYYKLIIFCSTIFFGAAAVLLYLRLLITRKVFVFI